MAAPYLYYDPKNPPPRGVALIVVAFMIGVIIYLLWWDSRDHMTSDANEAPTTSAEFTAVMQTARGTASRSAAMNITQPAHVAESFEGFSFTGMHWQCSATDYGTLRSVLEVSFATEGVFGFALAGTTDPAPHVYIVPVESMGGVGIVGFDNPDMRRLYVALSGSPDVNNGWQALGFVDLPAPASESWCGYNGVFRLTYPGGYVDGRAYVSVHDPTEDPLR